MTRRKPGDPGYLGPETEAQREREIIAARQASPKRTIRTQQEPGGMFDQLRRQDEPQMF